MVSVGRLLHKHLETLLALEKLHFGLAVGAALGVRAGRVRPRAAITLAALRPEPTRPPLPQRRSLLVCAEGGN